MGILDELSDKVWKTKNARFAAASRMRHNHAMSSWSMAISSLGTIIINIISFLDIFKDKVEIIVVLTISLSALTLVLSLIVERMAYSMRELSFHRCGLNLDKLNQQIRLAKEFDSKTAGITKEQIQDFQQQYYAILKSCDLNHTKLDYLWATMKEFDETCRFRKFMITLKWWLFRDATIYMLVMVSVLLIIIALLLC